MTDERSFGPDAQPWPEGGWSEQRVTLDLATVVPPVESGFVQEAGVLDSDGAYCPHGALWRRYRPITVEPPVPADVGQTLEGRWLWGGVLWVHFGHFLVESTSRLWGLHDLDQPVDGILFIPKRPKVGDAVQGFQRDFISLMAPDLPIHVATDPTLVEQLVVPGQGFGLGQIAHGTARFRDAMHAQFARDIPADGPERLYISRSALGLGKGGLLGEEHLEDLLRAEGYEIFHPQQHDMRTQIAHYKAAKQVIGADGSALHMFAMVGRPDQPVAMILRRTSGANTHLANNIASFCGRDPLVIKALKTEWLKASKGKSDRHSFGELDHAAIGQALHDGGFVQGGLDWPVLSDEQRQEILRDKGLDTDAFVESPEFVRKRKRAERRAKRALKAAE